MLYWMDLAKPKHDEDNAQARLKSTHDKFDATLFSVQYLQPSLTPCARNLSYYMTQSSRSMSTLDTTEGAFVSLPR